MKSLTTHNRVIVARLIEAVQHASERQSTFDETRLPRVLRRLMRDLTAGEIAVGTCVIALLAGLMTVLVSCLVGLGVVVLGFLVVAIFAAHRQKRRTSMIERDLPVLFTAVASSVRAGIDPLRAICDAEGFLPAGSPITREVVLFKQRLAAGDDESVAVGRFFEHECHRDVELFKHCIVLSRRHGSSLAEPLHRVVRVVRQRQSFKRKTRAALAMHQMSAFGILLCAILVSSMQIAVNMAGVRVALADARGLALLSVGGSLVVIGVVWMTRMGKEEQL